MTDLLTLARKQNVADVCMVLIYSKGKMGEFWACQWWDYHQCCPLLICGYKTNSFVMTRICTLLFFCCAPPIPMVTRRQRRGAWGNGGTVVHWSRQLWGGTHTHNLPQCFSHTPAPILCTPHLRKQTQWCAHTHMSAFLLMWHDGTEFKKAAHNVQRTPLLHVTCMAAKAVIRWDYLCIRILLYI